MEKLYKLQIVPSYEVGSKVKKFKKMLFNRIGEYKSCQSLPHITLISFITDSRWEHELVNAIKKSAQGCSKLSISLKGFSHFHQSGTLYMQVEHLPILQLLNRHIHGNLRRQAIRLRMPLNDLRIYQNPHMTIGSGLSPADLAAGFDLLMDQQFEGAFEVSQLKFLCFSEGKGTHDMISEFQLEGKDTPMGSTSRGASISLPSNTISDIQHHLITTGYTGQQLNLFA